MTIEIKAPTFPESVQDGSIATWHKKPGEAVSRDELIVDIETDKVVLEVVAPADGSLSEILKEEGDTVLSNEVIAKFEEGAAGSKSDDKGDSADEKKSEEKSESKPADSGEQPATSDDGEKLLSPAARKMADENNIDPNSVPGTGKDGRVTKEDVANFLKSGGSKAASAPSSAPAKAAEVEAPAGDRAEKRVPMTRLRKRIAERLLEASNTTAMLTTFNEVNMGPIMELRAKYKDQFEKSHDGTRLGFMGFFVKAAAEALRRFPAVNASIDNNDVVYHGYQDIGVAVSTDKGLVVPVLRNAESMGLADIESTIRDYGLRARDGKLGIEEMTGGTFTITNGGVFGSLLSTPILNLPQSAILGMHKIQERPMAVNGEVKILPMMYLALSYDHRLLDGKEAVQFLVTIKDLLEDPARILLEI
ncbi:2-oxoglutarate dehydrogenase complex dihydrolipoyllysine-residue succinyltransferase [Marinimicrobium koreense]|jgi:2-oxoglutarate dehydrogenase E2 component (dihydrolipoamide succinyltransferase)|uniref:Dihydrolipoyllysine-residue succinyltransferase component of 2-oxoglutarate dehydrogenase complex n=1 Tax=Marinimicrobium koreense TaxID=306545 RepID=A0A3N1NWA4_9GAMM|nr:2-oxoglutarate dehydrogenase complex dihydrolipoyllysine-residue succinyltransferase [Marinimicrobium koreense]ROQ20465.1 2-oxoglutarate dehydrogenase E2 component [Marinimicrobium koreense]